MLYLCTIKLNISIMTTATQKTIETLLNIVNNADVATIQGRGEVADSCKQLYNLIEEDTYKAGKDWMLSGMYNDLCSGNFGAPFYCQKKKEVFTTIVAIYNNNIVPSL